MEQNLSEIFPCPSCKSSNTVASGDDCDGMVNCEDCSLSTPICYGTKSAILIWNAQTFMEQWCFMDEKAAIDCDYVI